jgi:apurinic endonuclease APN1
MLETSAGSGDHIGSRFSELGRIIKAVNDPRVAVCLDTQHVWAAGYNIVEKAGLDDALDQFDREIGLDLLIAVHANDSKKELGSAVDRHDNIGEGLIGRAGFANLMAHDAFRDVPFYLEVPGFEKNGPDAPNVQALKEIRAGLASR